MITTGTIELIERYILGALTGAELAAFENRLKQEPELARETAQYGELVLSLKAFGREAALRDKFRTIKGEIGALPLKALRTRRPKANRLPQYLATGAIAAGIAVLVTIGVGRWLLAGHERNPGIQELVNDLKSMNSKVDSLLEQQNPEIRNMEVSFGTAFPISSNGYLLTSHHIVREAERIFVELPDKSRFRASLVYSDPTKDLAVLRAEDSSFRSFGRLPYSFASQTSRLGEYVYTLGYSKQDAVFTEGSVSSLTGFEEDSFAYQVSIPANPGNSGGPVLDDQGHIIGLLSGKHSQQEGAAFSTKSNYILSFLDEMKSDTSFTDLALPKGKSLARMKRPEQVETLHGFIYKVRVYTK
jgi:S1-C subfamily serine protease